MTRRGRPDKYRAEVWEHCRRLSRKGLLPGEISPLVGIPAMTIYGRRLLETKAGSHDWGHPATRKGPKPKFVRRCWSCQQIINGAAMDAACPHCGHTWRIAA